MGALLDFQALDRVSAGPVGAAPLQVAAARFGAEGVVGVGDRVALAVVAEQAGGVPSSWVQAGRSSSVALAATRLHQPSSRVVSRSAARSSAWPSRQAW